MARPRKRIATDLSRFLDAELERLGMTHNEFSKLVGMSPASVSDLKLRAAGQAPDDDMVRRWAEVLELSQARAHELNEKLQLAFTPRYVQDLLVRLRGERRTVRAAEKRSPFDEKP